MTPVNTALFLSSSFVNMHHSLVQWQLTCGLNVLLKEQEEEEMFLMISERDSSSYSSSQGVHFSEVFPKHFLQHSGAYQPACASYHLETQGTAAMTQCWPGL